MRAAKLTVLYGFVNRPRPKMAAISRRDETCAASLLYSSVYYAHRQRTPKP